MNVLIAPLGHSTLRLADLDPGKSPAFSPNLHKYLKSKGHFYRGGGIAEGVFSVRSGTRAEDMYGAGTLMIGYLDDGFFIGTQLISVLCKGGKAESMAHPIGKSVDPVGGFWDNYLKIGRCAIDQAHQVCFMADRFNEQSNSRTCLWCGHRQRKVITPRVVHDESWMSE